MSRIEHRLSRMLPGFASAGDRRRSASTDDRRGNRRLLIAGALASSLAGAVCVLPSVALAATPGQTISGIVAVPTGTNPAHVKAVLMHDGSEVATASVTTLGIYSFSDLANGPYQVYFVDSTPADDVAPEYYGSATDYADAESVNVANADLALGVTTLTSGGELTGTVTNPNSTSGASIAACPTSAADPGQTAYLANASGCVTGTLGSSGSYGFGGLVTGAGYRVQYTFASTASPSWSDTVYPDGTAATIDPGAATSVTPTGGAAVTQSFTVPSVGSIAGTVTDPSGLPDAGGSFVLTDSSGTPVKRSPSLSNGTYTLAGLLPGSYAVEFIPSSPTLAAVYYAKAVTLAAATKVTVGAGGSVTGLNLTTTRGASISGTVTAAQGGAVLGGIEVAAVAADGSITTSTITAANGTYTLSRVPAGSWHLEFIGGVADNGVRYQREYYGATTSLAGSSTITIAAGATLKSYNQAMMQQSTTAPGLPTLSNGWTSGEANNATVLRFKLTSGTGPAGYIKSFKLHLPTDFNWNKSRVKRALAIANDTYTEAIQNGWLLVTFPTGKRTVSVKLNVGAIALGGDRQALAEAGMLGPQSFSVWVRDTVGMSRTDVYTAKNPS